MSAHLLALAGPVLAAGGPDSHGNRPVNWVALIVVIVLFVVVAVIGFLASRWRTDPSARGMHSLDEWGLGGRGFGTWITWFLLGGDLYTAYTFVAVPAAMWASGAVSGFFAVPYTIVLYPIVFLLMSRLWSVSHRHGYVTPADFVGGRYGSRWLSVAVAVTGILVGISLGTAVGGWAVEHLGAHEAYAVPVAAGGVAVALVLLGRRTLVRAERNPGGVIEAGPLSRG